MPFSQRLPSGIGDDRKDTCDLSYFNSGLGSLVNSSNLFNADLVGSQSPSQQITYNLYGQGSGSSSLGMSALNLPQTSRTIANQQLSRGFGTGSVTGHVTPTSSGFPSGLPNILSPQAASPNRGILPLSVRSILSGKTPEIKRSGLSNSSSLSGLGSFGMPPGRPFNAHSMVGNLHSSFGGAGDSNNPPTLDLSEFPSLSARGHGDSVSQPNPMVGRAPYGNIGMVKQPQSETAEFTMSSEDFPALPGSNSSESSMSGDKNLTNLTEGPETFVNNRAPGAEKSYSNKRGIQTASDGKVTNIPSGMVTDQFGMVGLLTFIRVAETDPNLVSLALGQDLTTLGLNLNSPESLYPTFGGPWAEMPCRPQDIDFHVPVEYLININIRDKLAQVKLNRYGEDLLFYLFYTYVGDLLQMYAAAELYNRDWRYHKEERVWITRAPGLPPVEKTNTYERGTYYFFDAQNWRKVAKEFHLDYDKLEEHPTKNQAV